MWGERTGFMVLALLNVIALAGCGRGGSGEEIATAEIMPDRVPAQAASSMVPTGTIFEIWLDERVSTDRNRVGDPFTATLTDPVVDLDDQVLLPAGATVRGRVTSAYRTERPGDTTQITLAFEAVSFEGRSHPLQAMLVEIETGIEDESTTPARGKDGDEGERNSVPVPMRVSTVSGTMLTLGGWADIVLPAGARLVIRLTAPVEVSR